MLRTKEDIIRHADDIFRKAKNETERKSRCFFIAQLFSKINEYSEAKNYVLQYLSVMSDSSPAYKLLAQAYEGLGQLDNAVTAYENSLKYDPAQIGLLLKICELYCTNKITFNPDKVKSMLDKTQNCFPHHHVIINLKEKIMANGSNNDKEEYEKLLNVEIKSRPSDCSVRIKMLKLYLETSRIELAYRTICEIEKKGLFKRHIEWYECCTEVCDAYRKNYQNKCDSKFYLKWLHILDTVCTLSYSVSCKKSLYDCYSPACKFDCILNEACNLKESHLEFKESVEHFSAQLSFHIAILIAKKTKEDCDYSSEIQKMQIWSERKTKIGSLLLLSIKNGVPKSSILLKTNENHLKSEELGQGVTRYIESFYTLKSLAKNNNQGEKQFLDGINFFTSGQWRAEIYKIFSHLPQANASTSHFLLSTYYRDIPQKFPSASEINSSLFMKFELNYNGSLHNMIWLGLQTVMNINEPLSTRIDPNLSTNSFKSLNLTTANLTSCSIESLNQLDVDSFLYLTIFCKALSMKQRGADQPVTLPSVITSILCSEKEERFWSEAVNLSRNCKNSSENMSENSDSFQSSRLEIQKVLEQIRGNNLQLPLIVHLARTFSKRALNENGLVEDACEKRALYLWDLVLINLKNKNHKMNNTSITINNKNSLSFHYDVPNFTHSEVSMISAEARMFLGCHYLKCRSFEKALEIFKLIQSPESLYKQAIIYEALSVQTVEGLRGHQVSNVSREDFVSESRSCLMQALEMINSSGDKNHLLSNQITDKLKVIDRMTSRRPYNPEEENNDVNSEDCMSLENSDIELTLPQNHYTNSGSISSNHQTKPISSTPRRRNQDYRARSYTANALEISEQLTLHQNTNQLKLQHILEMIKSTCERIESLASDQRNIKSLIEELTSRIGKLETDVRSNFSDLKKELKQKPDLYNMLDDEEYSTDDVLNYQNMPNYFPRGSNMANIANNTVNYPPTATPLPPAAYFPPNSLYQGNLPFYGQSPFSETQQMAEYLRSLATGQRGNSLSNLPGGLPLQSAIVNTPIVSNLPHLQMATATSPLVKNTGSQAQIQSQAPNNVVITTSDALPTNVPTTAPTLFVNIPPEHRLGTSPAVITSLQPSTSGTVPHKFQIPMPQNFKLVEKAPVADPADDENIEATLDVSKESDSGATLTEHDPLPNFKPIIPLPDEVEIKTGEENETVIFDCRSKLFRFVDKEWKERGVGQLKILKSNDETPRFRILMRRDQVHKICANHFITEEMKLVKTQNSDRCYIWWAHDFADEKVEVEKFLARFKNVEDGLLFKEKFDEAKKFIDEMVSAGNLPKNCVQHQDQSNKTVLTPPKLGVSGNNQNKLSSETAGKDSKILFGGFTFSSQPKLTEVSKDKEEDKTKQEKKPVFSSFRFGTAKTDDKSQQQPLFNFTPKATEDKSGTISENSKCESSKIMEPSKNWMVVKHESGSWECSACYTRNPSGSKACLACKEPHKSSKTPDTVEPTKPSSVVDSGKTDQAGNLPSLSSLFKPPVGSWTCDECLVQNKADDTSCAACGSLKPGCKAAPKSAPATTFSFGIPPSNQSSGFTLTPSTTNSNVFGVPHNDNSTNQSSVGESSQAPGSSNIFTFGIPASGSSSSFNFGSPKFNFTMASTSKSHDEKSPQTTPKSAHKSDADESENEHEEEEDKDHTEGIYFHPVVDHLPDKIEVKTGEEDEIVLYSQRSKLFRYVAESKEWKERGLGDIKILKHKVTNKIRLLMRREPVMKLCLNHYVSPDIEMKAKDLKSWIWCAADYSEGEQTIEQFCIRFKTPDIAQAFKENFDRIKRNPEISSPLNSDSDDVIFISESKIVSDELKEKALALKLPENFYKYLDYPVCVGCRGCLYESDDENNEDATSSCLTQITPSSSQTKSLGGNNQKTNLFENKSILGTPSNIFGAVSVTPTTNTSTGGVLTSKSLFGDGPVKLPILTSTFSEMQTKQEDKTTTPTSNVSKSQDLPTTPSQISTFSFATPLMNKKNSTSTGPAFSFAQDSLFAVGDYSGEQSNETTSLSGGQDSTPSVPVFEGTPQNTPIFGGQNTPTIFGSVNATSANRPFFGALSSFTSPINQTWQSSQNQSFDKSNATQSTTPIFGSLSVGESTEEAAKTKAFDSVVPQQQEKKEPSFLAKTSEFSFESVAKSGNNNVFAGDNSSFKWEGAGTSIFSAKKSGDAPCKSNEKQDESGDDEEVNNDGGNQVNEHDPHFEPIVPLPDKIELKSGEEDEDVVFSERAKLYRMDKITKEWKERGVGIMKLLHHHHQQHTYRLLMRREQVHKIVCNHLVTPNITLSPLKSSETSYIWGAMNLSQDDTEPISELLCIKFKNKELALQFKNAFELAQKNVQETSPSK